MGPPRFRCATLMMRFVGQTHNKCHEYI
ncbi:hypothetical protein LINPERPRIM_LOCUS42519 [Linum perenne]